MEENKNDTKFVEKDLQAAIAFLDGMCGKIIDRTRNIDTQAGVLIGIGTGVFALSVNEMLSTEHFRITLIIVSIFSAVSAIVALCAVRPPGFMIKKGQEESLMYTRKISSFSSAKEYSQELKKVLESDDSLFHQYSIEIYNLSKYYYRPKRNLFAASRNIFLAGVVFSLIVILAEALL